MPTLLKLAALFVLAAPALAQQPAPPQPPIDPNWVYITPLRWVHAVPVTGPFPWGTGERTTSATVLVLYPTGQFAELTSGLIEHGREHAVTFSNFEGLEIRRGTWSRIDDRLIRIQSRQILKLTRSPARILCDPAGANCNPTPNPIPGPLLTETCALAGRSKDHLAQTIRCNRVTASPLHIPLSLADLQNLTAPAE